MTGKHGNNQQGWWWGQEAERSHVPTEPQSREKKVEVARALYLKVHSQGHTSSSKAVLPTPPPHIELLTGD